MSEFVDFSIKVKNFKCFGEYPSGFETIKPINLIIGRNNSGKSALIDLIKYVAKAKGKFDIPKALWNAKKEPEFIAKSLLANIHIIPIFSDKSCSILSGRTDREIGMELVGTPITYRIDRVGEERVINLGLSLNKTRPLDAASNRKVLIQSLTNAVKNPFSDKHFRWIHPERNILPEESSNDANNLNINEYGIGATNIIQNFLTQASLESDLVEVDLLTDLNKIFSTDSHFERIVCQLISNKKWEIYLDESNKGRIALSQSGSGLKTIILVLAYIHLIPVATKTKLSEYIFAFEELENNLHPSLFRRLLIYIKNCAVKEKCTFFLTTHSNVAIDLLNKNEETQILHVTHDKKIASVKAISTFLDNKNILDDLDVRASDLLQSNCVIWVEGPSDRIYLNRWISLWTDGELTEGNQYQCLFYGGKLLSHLSSDDPEEVEGSISILRVNRNSLIMIDSDKKNKQAQLNNTKKRIITEMENNSGIAWVTNGKEIENYISSKVIAKWLGENDIALKQCKQYENFFDHLDSLVSGKGKYFKEHKPLLAGTLESYFEKEDLENILDLSQQLTKFCNKIKDWNNA